MALNHFPDASAEEITVTAALVSARGNLAPVPVLLQNLREKVAAVSLRLSRSSVTVFLFLLSSSWPDHS